MNRLPIICLTIAILCAACSPARQLIQQEDDADKKSPDGLGSPTNEKIFDARTEYLEGIQEFELENYETAIDHLMAAYVQLPDEPGINFALADAYYKVGDLANASYYGQQATRLEPQNKWYHLKLYQIYRKAGKNEATIKELKAILDHHPKDVDVLRKLASTYNRYGEHLKANQVYNRILDLSNGDINIYLQKFHNFKELEMQDSAMAELQKIRRLDPDNISIIHTLSEYYINKNKPVEAKELLRNALDQNPRNPRSLIMMAEIHIKEAQWDSAGSMLQNIVTDSLISTRGKIEVARYLFSKFKESTDPQLREQTEKIMTLLTRHEAESGLAHALAADYYKTTKQINKALFHLGKTTEHQPSNGTAWRERVRLLYTQGLHDEVIKVGKKADEHASQDPFITFFIGSSYLVQQNHQEAIDWLVKACDLPARSNFKSIVYASLADAYSAVDRWESAKEAYEKALELNPDNHNAMNNYAYYLSKRDEQLEYAKKLALKALEGQPNNASYLDTAGWVFYKLGNYSKAKDYIKRAIERGSASAVVLEHLGDVNKKLGNTEEAHLWWRKAFNKDTSKTYLKRRINNNSSDQR